MYALGEPQVMSTACCRRIPLQPYFYLSHVHFLALQLRQKPILDPTHTHAQLKTTSTGVLTRSSCAFISC